MVSGSPWLILQQLLGLQWWTGIPETPKIPRKDFHRDCLGGWNPRAPLIRALHKQILHLLPTASAPAWDSTSKSQVARFEISILKSHLSFWALVKNSYFQLTDYMFYLLCCISSSSPLQPLSPHGKQFHANLLRFLWGVVGNRTLLSNGISTSIWHPSWHFTLHIIIYSVM